jgi:hypothetical protein
MHYSVEKESLPHVKFYRTCFQFLLLLLSISYGFVIHSPYPGERFSIHSYIPWNLFYRYCEISQLPCLQLLKELCEFWFSLSVWLITHKICTSKATVCHRHESRSLIKYDSVDILEIFYVN